MRRRRTPTHPADSLQGRRIDLVHVVDLGGGVVVFTVADDVDQVVIGEVGDDVAEVREGPKESLRKVNLDNQIINLTV